LAITVAIVLLMRQAPQRPSFEDEDQVAEAPAATEGAAVEARPAEAVAPAVEAPDAQPPPAEVGAPAAEGTPAVADAAVGEPTAPEPPATGRELRIVATEETWLALAIDAEPKKEFLLQPGETRTWTARDAFVVTLGNAGGVTLVLDGRELPKPGKSGDVVRNLRLPPQPDSPAPPAG
jgi:cytoskeleton protein RodZ